MISVNLATPVIFYKQLPGIAKKLDVDADFLKGFLTNARCYVEDAGKGEVLELDNSADTITKVVAAHEKRFYGAEAIVEFAKSKGVDILALNHFELGADISAHATEDQVANITALAARVERLNSRYKSLARLEAPDVILMNEARMVREAVEQLEDNSGTYSPALDQNGVAYQSLKDIGYSLVTGWDKSVLEKNSNKDTEATFPKEPDFQRLASLVKKAIGTRTQGKFAFQAGLARGYISNLVNGNAKAQPTENTLKKIASATDAVTENELRIACGYEPLPDDGKDKLSMQRASMSDDAWQKDNVDAFLSFLNKTIPMSTPLSSTEILQALFNVVDATRDLLMNVLKYHPFLIKPNNHELGEIFGVTLKTREEVIPYGRKLQEKGARNVLISMAGEGAVLIAENGEVYSSPAPKGTLVNGVGAGDSMVAGFITGYIRGGNYEEALKSGTAAGSATAFSEGLASLEMYEKMLKQISE